MKVVHIGCTHRPDDTRIYQKECLTLANAGYDVTFITSECLGWKRDHQSPVKIITVKIPNPISFVKNPIGHIRWRRILQDTLFQAAIKEDADVYHIHESGLISLALKFKKLNKIVVYDSHENAPSELLEYFSRRGQIKKWIGYAYSKFFQVYENYCIKRLDYIITAAPFVEKRFKKLNTNTVCVCNFPDVKQYSTCVEYSAKKDWICYVGAISELRGITQLVDSIANLNVRLQLAGDIPLWYRDKLSSRPGWKKVDEYGYVDSNKIFDIYQYSRIGMVALLPGPNHMTTIAIKMFEYMAAGIPVIYSNFTYWRELIEDTKCGIHVNPLQPSEIADAIKTLIDNPEKARIMGENGKRAIENKFNWNCEKEKLLKVYDSFF